MLPISRAGVIVCFTVLPVCAQMFEEKTDLNVPLTAPEKAKRTGLILLSPGAALGSLIGAGIDQLDDFPREWGQGTKGYGHRFISLYGRKVTESAITLGLDAAMKTDPRYVPCTCTAFKPRLLHAISRTFITRKDKGGEIVNIPLLAGYVGGSAIGNQWLPDRLNTAGNFAQTASIDIAIGAGLNVTREFWPEIKKKIPFLK